MTTRTPNPLGPIASGPPAQHPSHDTQLTGRYVRLVGLAPAHAAALYPQVSGDANAPLWDYMPDGPFHDRRSFDAYVASRAASRADPVFYAILPRDSDNPNDENDVLGHISLMRIAPEHRRVEIGHVLFAPRLRRTRAATEAAYLLARHALEDLGFRRCEWKCDARNAASRRAAARLGFAPEGVFRRHMVVKGRERDTAWYALLAGEEGEGEGEGGWPAAKRALEEWLDPGNFDERGVQRKRLEELRQ